MMAAKKKKKAEKVSVETSTVPDENAETDGTFEPSAGVEGRSLDSGTDASNEKQSSTGEFVKEFVLLATEIDKETAATLSRNIITQATQVGLRPAGDPKVGKGEQQSDGKSMKVKVILPVVRAGS